MTALLLFILVGCPSGEHSKPVEQDRHEDAGHQQRGRDTLHLDHGDKWNANAATTRGIRNMQKLIKQQPMPADTSAYRLLGEALKAELEKCTMRGLPHDQLHLYLGPLAEHVRGLKKGGLKERKSHYEKIKIHLAAYFHYFK